MCLGDEPETLVRWEREGGGERGRQNAGGIKLAKAREGGFGSKSIEDILLEERRQRA